MNKYVWVLATLVLGVSLSSAQTSDTSPTSDPNRSGATTATRTDESAPRDHNWGWIGLLGLAGLGGLRGRRTEIGDRTSDTIRDARRAA
ncbi:MAG: hypothetical protein NVS1B11_34990 [Terriglobales bacterium]